MFRQWALVSLVFLSLAFCQGAKAEGTVPDKVELRVGESRQLEIKGLTRFEVGSAEFVKVAKLRSDVLEVTGQKDGVTFVRAFAGKNVHRITCFVNAAESASEEKSKAGEETADASDKEDKDTKKASKSVDAAKPSSAEGDFLQPGDVIALDVFGEQALSKTYQVDDDGNITMPLLDKVRVGGLTLVATKDKLTKALAKYLVDPVVKVTLARRTDKALGHVTIVGHVEKAGSYPVQRGEQLRVFQWLLQAGVKPSGDLSRVQLTRESVSKEPRFLNIQQLVDGGKPDDNIVILPGDIIFVPEMQKVNIYGAIKRPGPLQVPGGLTLMDIIIQAEGALPSADFRRVEITRANGPKITVNLHEAVQKGDPQQNPVIQPGDSIFVPPLKGMRVVGQVQRPGMVYTSDERITVVAVLQQVGDPLNDADLAKAQIVRENGEIVPLDLDAILRGNQPSVDMQPGDTLFIPKGAGFNAGSGGAGGPPKVTVYGEVKQRGAITLTEPKPLLDLLQDVGAVGNDFADLENVEVAFKDGTKKVINIDKLLREADQEQNLVLKGGERIYVPKLSPLKVAVYVTGGVARPGIIKFEKDMTMFQAILAAGGAARYSKREVSISRMNPETKKVEQLKFDFQKIKKGEAEDPHLLPGDVVYVGEGKPPFNWQGALGTASQLGWLLYLFGGPR
jgi:polysaccharide export outer membrane protein